MQAHGCFKIMCKLKSIIFIFIAMFNSSCMANSSCNVTVYYLPLEVEFYAPPTLEYIKKYGEVIDGRKLESVCKLISYISTKDGIKELHGEDKRLRILIVDNNTNKNIFLTSSKKIVVDGMLFKVDEEVFDLALMEIVNTLKSR
jgi:hypothetical protein